ncbi:hypothetical protein C8Q80DRAFT_1269288 [Daedaleopsis nitida]|nr:hypothetical protein C8Q80DRAFT_1269288 [Daedaleopsis nitida]
MSCSLCRLPFTPGRTSLFPRVIPEGMLTHTQKLYMQHALGVSPDITGLVLDLEWLGGAHAGMLKGINYKTALKHDGKPISIDIESLWYLQPGASEGEADFDWIQWRKRGLEWTAARPNVFPRFRPQVPPARLASLGPIPVSTTDVVTTQPLDVLHAVLPYLDNKSFMHLLATCRTLRRQALTTLQPQARARVLALGWAVPVEWEYQGFVARSRPETAAMGGKSAADIDLAGLAMAHETHSPVDADWHLYLSQVHRSSAMRTRRWQWALAGELARVYREKKAAGPYADGVDKDGKIVRSKAWEEYARKTRPQLSLRPEMFKKPRSR